MSRKNSNHSKPLIAPEKDILVLGSGEKPCYVWEAGQYIGALPSVVIAKDPKQIEAFRKLFADNAGLSPPSEPATP